MLKIPKTTEQVDLFYLVSASFVPNFEPSDHALHNRYKNFPHLADYQKFCSVTVN